MLPLAYTQDSYRVECYQLKLYAAGHKSLQQHIEERIGLIFVPLQYLGNVFIELTCRFFG